MLHEERPVVETEAVPVERVRLGTETVTDEQTVTGDVRKEESRSMIRARAAQPRARSAESGR